jgi:hypothetical protein
LSSGAGPIPAGVRVFLMNSNLSWLSNISRYHTLFWFSLIVSSWQKIWWSSSDLSTMQETTRNPQCSSSTTSITSVK